MGERRHMPDERTGLTKRIRLQHARGELKIYVSTGCFADGRIGEIFLKGDRPGSTISGLLDALSITASVALQYGVPVETLVEKWSRMRFEPAGSTDDPEMRTVSSIVDAVARWLRTKYVKEE